MIRGLVDNSAFKRELSNSNELGFTDITYITFEAVTQVVLICFTGFVAAHSGLLKVEGQKIISQLNVDLFTPCLVFTKLASSLSFKKMLDVIVIPIFYAMSTGISYICSRVTSSMFELNESESDFVTAMAVFGNSNSLPVSLTLSLAYTMPGLLWEDEPDDTPDKVASRGILYLLIFQQLGQILRWSWGYNKLLRKRSSTELNHYPNRIALTDGGDDYETAGLLSDSSRPSSREIDRESSSEFAENSDDTFRGEQNYPVGEVSYASQSLDAFQEARLGYEPQVKNNWALTTKICGGAARSLNRFANTRIVRNVLNFMNPPLYAMLVSITVASVPALQDMFFGDKKTFVRNTLTSAVEQLGSVSIPLILVVLGSNLAPSASIPPPSRHYARIIISSLLSRMILPSLIILPIVALCVKFVKISILDDPIFLIVAFILTISPPAIQLSQIIQINNIYQKEMSGVLFWSYVILTLPTTIFIVTASLEVLKWADK
ncbi:Piso0_001386 [Millerozyma farinosa CBS 7064]|uniref:Piso0_001386 protein n=1 Tax=Pichia sorbitophila (strain ATCC MYA-4447 / BCRC 22081 / CBS 7064 / NBRC 10061 / NRRL Y-12695) TaxID=559304 RepID=G8YN11_PICSO|nr:Piso0_001386 [Millerozyma farinosa CBS 7064]